MKFLIDENLPPKLAHFLIDRGHDAVHVLQIGLAGSTDRAIADRAVQEGRVILSRDSDFERFSEASDVRVLLVCVGNTSTTALITWISSVLDFGIEALQRGQPCVRLD